MLSLSALQNTSEKKEDNNNPYNADATVNLYIHFHYSSELHFSVSNFPKAVAEIAIAHTDAKRRSRVLDLGCATGRTSFELTKAFESVTGIDYAQKLVDVALEFKKNKYLEWTVIREGEILDAFNCSAKDIGVTAKALERVQFLCGDAHALPPQCCNYDCVVACNLIDRLHSPAVFLRNVHELIASEGVLILLDPYTWLPEYTAKEKWIGGRMVDNKPVTTFEALQAMLSPTFDLVKQQDVPFVIRETARKYQHVISHCTIWRRK